MIFAVGGSPLLQRKLLIPVQQSRPLSHHCPDGANSRNPSQFSAAQYIKDQSSIQYLHQNQRKPYEYIFGPMDLIEQWTVWFLHQNCSLSKTNCPSFPREWKTFRPVEILACFSRTTVLALLVVLLSCVIQCCFYLAANVTLIMNCPAGRQWRPDCRSDSKNKQQVTLPEHTGRQVNPCKLRNSQVWRNIRVTILQFN